MAQYGPELWWYPDESIAANIPVNVFPRASRIHANIYSDAGLTIPLPNPTSTDASGVLTFYAAPGDYWLHLSDLTFDVTINDGSDESWHITYLHTQSIASSTWIIFHQMNTHPDVTVRDSTGTEVQFANITYPDLSTAVITFNSPLSGFADLRR